MIRNFILMMVGLTIGLVSAFLVIDYPPVHNFFYPPKKITTDKHIIGFLPYWLAAKAKDDYASYITTLSYFGLTLDTDGSVMKRTNPTEAEPGWHALDSGILDGKLKKAKDNDIKMSLVVFNADPDVINQIVSDPVASAGNTVRDVLPVMRKHGFTDLNVDIETVAKASPAAQAQFTTYIKEIKTHLSQLELGTLSIDISPDNILRTKLIDLKAVAPYVDHVVIMGYDYHYNGSTVTGAVGPLYGAGKTSEFDTQAAVELAQKILPVKKIILGIPLYGYEWETIDEAPGSGIIPGTGLTASNQRVEKLLAECSSCSAAFDNDAKEAYVIYYEPATSSYHQLFYPDARSIQAKIDFLEKSNIGGLALWALGYEGESILNPLREYKR